MNDNSLNLTTTTTNFGEFTIANYKPYKCNRCGHEEGNMVFNNFETNKTCPKCVEMFLRANCGRMEESE